MVVQVSRWMLLIPEQYHVAMWTLEHHIAERDCLQQNMSGVFFLGGGGAQWAKSVQNVQFAQVL